MLRRRKSSAIPLANRPTSPNWQKEPAADPVEEYKKQMRDIENEYARVLFQMTRRFPSNVYQTHYKVVLEANVVFGTTVEDRFYMSLCSYVSRLGTVPSENRYLYCAEIIEASKALSNGNSLRSNLLKYITDKVSDFPMSKKEVLDVADLLKGEEGNIESGSDRVKLGEAVNKMLRTVGADELPLSGSVNFPRAVDDLTPGLTKRIY